MALLFMCFSNLAAAEDVVTTSDVTKSASVEVTEEVVPLKAETPEKIQTVNTKIIAEVDSTIIVKLDGDTLESTEVHRSEDGNLYVNAMPIFQHLGNDVEYDDVSKALIVRRSQDNVVMELYTDTGIVKANGRALGKLDHFGEVEPDHFILTPNAIAVLAGAAGQFDADTNEFKFKLDPRLRVATGFDIFVDDIPLGAVQPQPKSIGPVLLLPLGPIAEALGNTVVLLEGGTIVEIRRIQDSVSMTLNLSTGLVSANGKPVGLSKDITYIDQTNLLVPVSALEALTGTHVDVEGGSARIDITLDERLSGSIAPLQSIDDATKGAPFTPEQLSFNISPDTGVRAQFDSHIGRLNTRVRYELSNLPTSGVELQPDWLSVDYAHTNGISGSIGDYSANYRELDPVNTRRILGASAKYSLKSGGIAVAAGVPLTGVKAINDDQNRNVYSGFAAGVRYADLDGWEAGLAVSRDKLSKDQRAVLEVISGRLGRGDRGKKWQWNSEAAVGVFDGPARESTVDLRVSGDVRRRLGENFNLNLRAGYEGAEFLRSNLNAEAQADEIAEQLNPDAVFDDEELPLDIRRRGSDQALVTASLTYLPKQDFGILKNPTAGISGSYGKTGVLKSGTAKSEQKSGSVSVTASVGQTGLNLSGSVSRSETKTRLLDGSMSDVRATDFQAQAFKQFNDLTIRARYGKSIRSDAENRQSATITVSRPGFGFNLPKDAGLTIGPSLSGVWDGEDWRARGGLNAGFQSGELFGKKNVVSANLGILQSLSTRGDSRSDKFLSVSAGRRLNIGKNMSLGLAYRNDLRGDQRLGLQLDGNFNFNPKRAIKKTQDGRGILKGQVFLDKNRDGIRQATEAGIPRVVVRVKGTRLALRSGADGFFTIQNVKEGLYEVQIDAKSLPIGYDLSTDIKTRVTVSEGQITDVPLAIVQRGQIRGFAFEDGNGNGEYDRGETRVERAKLRLTSDETDIELSIFTTSFGQYAFDDLPVGTYNVEVMPSEKDGIVASQIYTVELDPKHDLMARQNLIISRGSAPKYVDVETTDPEVDETAPLKYRTGTVTIVDHDTPWDLKAEYTPQEVPPATLTPVPRLKPFTSGRAPDELSGAAPP
ncbi:MAG: SdrD B-like domain-containing protein [Litorimonas sp.]